MKLRRPQLGLVNLSLATVLVLLAAGGVWVVRGSGSAAETASASTTQVVRTDVSSLVSGDGTVEPAESRDVEFEVDATVGQVRVKVGDHVEAGEVLAVASDRSSATALAAAQAEVEAAEENYDAVEDSSEKLKDDARDQQRSAARAQVAKARLGVLEARESIDDLTLVAPVSGTVTAVNGDVGETTRPGGSLSEDSDSPFITIADLDSWVVECDFSEADVAKIHAGDPVEIIFGAVPDETFSGAVEDIDLTASTNDNVTTFGVTVAVTKAPKELRHGSSATVSVTTARATDVLAVPSSAVTTDAQGQSTVQRVEDGEASSQVVAIGIEGDLYTEITSGLKEGEVVELGATSTSADSTGRRGPGGGPVVINGPAPKGGGFGG